MSKAGRIRQRDRELGKKRLEVFPVRNAAR